MNLSLEPRPEIAQPVEPTASAHRLRRTRRTEPLRSLVRETRLHPRSLVARALRSVACATDSRFGRLSRTRLMMEAVLSTSVCTVRP